MKINILTIGKLKEKYWKDALLEYQKRLGPYCKFEIFEGPEEKAPDNIGEKDKQLLLAKEGQFFLRKMANESYNIALDLKGSMVTSEELAEIINEKCLQSGKTIQFLIGGSYGISPEVLKHCDKSIAFGRATFPHQMIRIFLTEQIYRSFRIIRNEPYHK